MKALNLINTLLVSTYFALKVNEMLKDNNVLTTQEEAPYDEEQLKTVVLDKLGPEFLEKLEQVKELLSELRKEPTTLLDALKFLKERKTIDPVLKVDG